MKKKMKKNKKNSTKKRAVFFWINVDALSSIRVAISEGDEDFAMHFAWVGHIDFIMDKGRTFTSMDNIIILARLICAATTLEQ